MKGTIVEQKIINQYKDNLSKASKSSIKNLVDYLGELQEEENDFLFLKALDIFVNIADPEDEIFDDYEKWVDFMDQNLIAIFDIAVDELENR